LTLAARLDNIRQKGEPNRAFVRLLGTEAFVMQVIKSTLYEVLILGVLGIVIGTSANLVRAKNAITIGRNYFDRGVDRNLDKAPAETPTVVKAESPPRGDASRSIDDALTAASVDKTPPSKTASPPDEEEKHLDHPYQEIQFDQVKAIFEGTDPTTGAYVFVDARNDHLYAEGHIPGAVQCDHYRLNDYIDDVLPLAQQVEKVIVYCNGGDCEDSIFMCGDLIDSGIPFERMYLYPGGWKQWIKQQMPVIKGKDPGSPEAAIEQGSAGDDE
jgi:rhodanese-related sulfurtransferase